MLLVRWLKFNAVGGLGIGVQLGVLALLAGACGINYLAATVIAVETAVLHNFAWHERYTWADRTCAPGGFWGRFVRFHTSNGLISIAGNAFLMRLLVGGLRWNYLTANLVAIAACGLINFAAAEWFVFRRPVKLLPHLPIASVWTEGANPDWRQIKPPC